MTGYLNLAIKTAARSPCHYRVGAVLAKGGRVLAHACNNNRNPPSISPRHATFHAEESLLRPIRPPRHSVIYVARIDRDGLPRLAKPCLRCQQYLITKGITRAHYTTSTGRGILRLT
ncbi:hypothetical protein [Streptomyces yunnanensis]|uniref:Deoxycytidylate deaminase n=1 Tax=Streptomyces yunnanensis TaxID=156453 RepID=A0A9X8R0F8_9ACTN|nr:hypothetical protein [Streptomyces yunnanensis]SHN34180.1 Deoxycytidylate deaminase [Streptomyces yunnanensis]